MPARDIDHVVIMTRDLAAAVDSWTAHGFTCTPRAVHPFGTANALIQLQGNFIELLEIDDAARIRPGDGDQFSFAQHNLDFLAQRGEGLSMLVLQSRDRDADLDEWRSRNLHVYAPFDFERQAKQPDGSSLRVAFSLGFADTPALPGLAFFVCQQHTPEAFWKPLYQTHLNGARRIVSVTTAAPDPSAARRFLADFAGAEMAEPITLVEDSLSVRTGETPAFPEITVAVADLNAARHAVPTAEPDGNALVVPRERLNGVTLRFVAQ